MNQTEYKFRRFVTRQLRRVSHQLRRQEQHTIKLSEVGTNWEIHQSQLHCQKLLGMKEAYEAMLAEVDGQ